MTSESNLRYQVNSEKVSFILSEARRQEDAFPKFAIFVVAYNAATTLTQTINRIPQELLPVIEEIYVFDDFSTDNTYDVGIELLKDYNWSHKLRIFKNQKNHGYGGNQKLGFQYGIAKNFDYIILLHGDGQYAPELLPDLIYPVLSEKKKVVFGSRMLNSRMALKGKMPFYKWIGNKILTAFENLVLGLKMSEFHSGYRLYSTAALKRIRFTENTDDFHFDTQIIVQCRALNEEIKEIPIPTYYGDEICRVNGIKYAINVCLSVIGYRLHQMRIIHSSRYVVIPQHPFYQFKKDRYSSHRMILSKIPGGTRVLDVGCGVGMLCEQLIAKGCTVVGMDILSKDEICPNLDRYYQIDLENMPDIPLDREFDYIILGDIVEHVRNSEKLLKELSKVLKMGGMLIASTGNIAIWFYRLSLLIGRFNYGTRGILDKTHVHLYTVDSFKRLFSNCGFRVVSTSYTGLPFEFIFESTGKSRLLRLVGHLYFFFVRLWPKLFAYQVIFLAQIGSPNALMEENLIFRTNERDKKESAN